METLKKNYEFKNVLKRGKTFKGKVIDIYYLKNNKRVNYIGIAVQKKVAIAVKRNRIKRLIRENYRLIEKDLKHGFDIVILWKKNINIENATFYNIEGDMKNFLKKDF